MTTLPPDLLVEHEKNPSLTDAHDFDGLFLGDSLQQFYAFTEPLIFSHIQPGDRLLDIGCGDGKLAVKLLHRVPLASLVGVDIRSVAVESARALAGDANVEFLHGDAQDLEPLQQLGSFDAILARTSLHHFHDPIGTLRDYADMLPPGGRLILVDIDRESAFISVFGFPLTLLITWMTVLRTLGWKAGWAAIRGMKYPSKEWREHRAQDVVHRQKIGWYRFADIRAKLCTAFPTARIGRLAAFCGLGGVHYMVYQKRPNG